MVTSQERQKANLARMKEQMKEIESTTNDFDLITELHRLIKKQYSLSLKWHMIVFKSEVDRSLWYLEDIRKEENEIEKRKRRQRKEPTEGPKKIYCKSSEILSELKLDYHMAYDTETNQYKWLKCSTSRNIRANIFAIPKSMIGDGKLQWSEEAKRKWGEDNIGQRELLERGIHNEKYLKSGYTEKC
jgi:hypothetical protein